LDLGNAAILPGFVNAHTHLDLTGLRGRTPPGPNFVDWLRAVIAQRREQQPDRVQRDIQVGLDECLDSGTTLIGDIAAGGQSYPVLAKSACRSVVFYELLGLSKPRAHQSWAAASAWLHGLPALPNCRPGLSPHAPYSVRTSLFSAVSNYAKNRDLPVAIHVAESLPELELLAQRSGPMVQFLQALGVYDHSGLIHSPDELIKSLGESKRTLLVHGNYLEPSAKALPGSCIVYCPRTHYAFGHPPYPLAEFLRSGARIALGTDSLASNPDLSLFNEARFVRRDHARVSPTQILRMATLSGAEALGWERETGSLTPGKAADLAIVSLQDGTNADPELLVLDETASVSGVMIGGRWHKDPRR
jgi:aminodeoxyfutalosine deaminase